MGICVCTLVSLALIIVILAYLFKKIYQVLYEIPELPKLDDTFWWGPGEGNLNEDTSIVPFKISVPDEDLADLKNRLLKSRRFTPPLQGIQHQYGINTKLLNEISEFWQEKYDWRAREAFLNQYSHFKTKIQGLNIHFIHIQPHTKELNVVPILLLHGWPGSIREFYEVIPQLIKANPGRNFVFEVIVPSLPGYGFSDPAARPGLNPIQIAVIMKNLMQRLGFDKWYVQGGDWGAAIGTCMSMFYPQHILGFHFNSAITQTPVSTLKLIIGSFWSSLIVSNKHKDKLYPLGNMFKKMLDETGYMHIQATRPDTVGVALNDSPIGLAAYILEKFIAWTNMKNKSCDDGGLLLKYDYNKLLDNIMIYWITNSITTSFRLYSEAFGKTSALFETAKNPIKVPCAFAQFEHELAYANKLLLQDKYTNLLQTNEYDDGGHFAAFEEPVIFAKDVWDAVEKFENFHKNNN